ncbi:hypothetical protein ACG7TL_004812 [Trametes sanguinea]
MFMTPSRLLYASLVVRLSYRPLLTSLSRTRTQMPSDPPSPARPQRPTHPRTQTTTARSALTPAQAIAQAWMRESPESQQKWRKADALAKEKYMNPIRWNTAGRSPERKDKGKL